MPELIELFLIFARIGCICFGGGYTILPILEKEFIQKRNWITEEEIIKYYTIAQITPGIISVNISTFIGYRRKKIPGGIVCTLGFILPSVTMISIISLVIKNFASYAMVQHCFAGIRLAVGALILDTVFKLIKNIYKKENSPVHNIIYFVLLLAAFLTSIIFNINPVLIVLFAGLTGFINFVIQSRRTAAGGGNDL